MFLVLVSIESDANVLKIDTRNIKIFKKRQHKRVFFDALIESSETITVFPYIYDESVTKRHFAMTPKPHLEHYEAQQNSIA